MLNGKVMIIHLIVGLTNTILLYIKMGYFLETDHKNDIIV